LPWLREAHAEALELADALVEQPGVVEVQARPFTGSVLVRFDPRLISTERLSDALCAAARVDHVSSPDEPSPDDTRAAVARSLREGSELSRLMAEAARGLHADFLRWTSGRVSLGTVATIALWLSAATRVAATGELQLPPWYQLIYYGFRTFGGFEGLEAEHVMQAVEVDQPDPD
jgi:hypothetical protein